MISLAYKISHCLSANHYPELRCVICTDVTLFVPVLNCTALSQSESSNCFMCIILLIKSFVWWACPSRLRKALCVSLELYIKYGCLLKVLQCMLQNVFVFQVTRLLVNDV